MVCYEHAKAVHSTRAEPRSGPRQGAWYTFHKHWLATGVAWVECTALACS